MNPRDLLQRRFQAAIAAVEPAAAVRAVLRREGDWLHCGTWRQRLPERGVGRVVVIGAGKASAPMAQAVEALLGDQITGGCVVVKYGHTAVLERIALHEAGHPVPDAAGERGVRAIEHAVYRLSAEDLVICCLSGGASALLPAPRAEVTLADKQAVTSLLLASGADIHAMNTVRKHLSRLKGGRLALACAPAKGRIGARGKHRWFGLGSRWDQSQRARVNSSGSELPHRCPSHLRCGRCYWAPFVGVCLNGARSTCGLPRIGLAAGNRRRSHSYRRLHRSRNFKRGAFCRRSRTPRT